MGWFSRHSFRRKKSETELVELHKRAQSAHDDGDLDGAQRLYHQLVDEARESHNRKIEAAALQRRGVMRDLLGDPMGAEVDVRAALAIDLELEGEDGPTVRQDYYTLGVVLGGAGRLDEAITALNESARVASVLLDDEAFVRAKVVVGGLRAESGDLLGAIKVLEEVRADAPDRRHTIAGFQASLLLVRLLAEHGQTERVSTLAQECIFLIGYWGAKHEMGAIDDSSMHIVLQCTLQLQLDAAQLLAQAGHPDAAPTFDLAERLAREIGAADAAEEIAGAKLAALGN
jgi:tetratricopeptide (TPR) repeat protein